MVYTCYGQRSARESACNRSRRIESRKERSFSVAGHLRLEQPRAGCLQAVMGAALARVVAVSTSTSIEGAGQPPSPAAAQLLRPLPTRAEVKVWLQQQLGRREGHSLHHIRWLEPGLGRWFFNTDDGVHGAELWETDMTSVGTHMLRDINPGSGSSFPSHKAAFGGRLYFAANDGEHGVELWVTDGTRNGTRLFFDV